MVLGASITAADQRLQEEAAMLREMLKSKIHRATVTQADLHYVGSVTISADLADAAGLLANERVDILDITNGSRLTTYVIIGPQHSGVIGINGAAAHLVQPGDLVIILGYGLFSDPEARALEPAVVFVDEHNRIVRVGHDPAEPSEDGDERRGDVVARMPGR